MKTIRWPPYDMTEYITPPLSSMVEKHRKTSVMEPFGLISLPLAPPPFLLFPFLYQEIITSLELRLSDYHKKNSGSGSERQVEQEPGLEVQVLAEVALLRQAQTACSTQGPLTSPHLTSFISFEVSPFSDYDYFYRTLHSTPPHSTPLHPTPLHSTPLHPTHPHPFHLFNLLISLRAGVRDAETIAQGKRDIEALTEQVTITHPHHHHHHQQQQHHHPPSPSLTTTTTHPPPPTTTTPPPPTTTPSLTTHTTNKDYRAANNE